MIDKIKEELQVALKEKNLAKVSTLRFLLAELHNQEIEKQRPLTDEEAVEVIARQVKQHRESIEAFKKGSREDLVSKEEEELGILSTYLPRQMDQEELAEIVRKTVEEVGAAGPNDFGKVMGAVMAKVKGQADGNVVSTLVRQALNSQVG